MAREAHDREDLLAEARALVERVSLRIDNSDEEIVVGFRRDRGASFYLGADCVYQTNSAGQLRRAFVDDRMVKAERGRLVLLTRERTADAVALVRHSLDDAQQRTFLEAATNRLLALRDAMADPTCRIVGQVPADVDVAGRVRRWLNDLRGPLEVALSPRAG
jgi:hypothetical protein